MIHFICALKSEAAPVLDYFALKYLPGDRPFNIYLNKNTGISLTVSGVGKLSAAAATSYTFATLGGQQNEIWINLGMAGHRSHGIGEIFICNKITDAASGRKWYPHLVLESDLQRNALVTLDRPSTDYGDELFDMEASGFVSTASRFSYLEFVQTLKFISDNADKPAHKFKPEYISSILKPHLDSIETIVTRLRAARDGLNSKVNTSQYYEDLLELCHFTDYQKKRLQQTLQRWCLLLPQQSPLIACPDTLLSANKVIQTLEDQLDSVDLSLSSGIENV